MRYLFGGLIFGGAYTRRGLFSEFYGMAQKSAKVLAPHIADRSRKAQISCSINNFKMNEAEYLLKNYGDRGSCTDSTDNTLRDIHNSSYDTKAEFNNCYIIHSK